MIGTQAKELFSTPGFCGRVLAVVSNAVYLQSVIAGTFASLRINSANQSPTCNLEIASHQPFATTDAEILWLAQNHLPMHTRALRGDFDLSALRVGMAFRSDGACLHFNGGNHTGLPLRFADARAWQSAVIAREQIAPSEIVKARARQLHDVIQGSHPSTEFILTKEGRRAGSGLPLPDELARACRGRDLVRVTEAVHTLIGLGEGLTPSGDDFVGGLLFAAHYLRAAYPGAFRWEQRAIDDLLDYARARTNVISCALLRDHARGQSVEPLHDLVAALLRGARINEIETHARRLSAIGATTGRALLAGVLTGISLARHPLSARKRVSDNKV